MDLLTCRENAEIAAAIPGIRNVLTCSRASMRVVEDAGGPVPIVTEDVDRALMDRLRSTNYRRAIALRRYMTESTLVLMSGVVADEKFCMWQMPTNTSRDAADKMSANWQHLTPSMKIRSEIDYYATVVSRILGQEIDGSPFLALPGAGEEEVEDGSIVLGLGANSSRWPILSWLSTAHRLRARFRAPIHLFGGNRHERVPALAISTLVSGTVNHVGRTKLLESLPYLRRASLVVANDTGFAHLAALVARRVLILQGGGTFARFFPWPGATNQHVLYRGMTCFDCTWECRYLNPLQRRACLTRISPSNVVRFAEEILSGTAPMLRNVGEQDGRYRLSWRNGPAADETMSFSAESLASERKGPFTLPWRADS